jgi:anti-sigma regulatory factor (Ser/Thr protein kinase)
LDSAVPPHKGEISELRSEGWGIYLMQALMDAVFVHSGDGTAVVMKKYITAKNPLNGK